jgi:membrane protein implicated in regulation of membrane protease activity
MENSVLAPPLKIAVNREGDLMSGELSWALVGLILLVVELITTTFVFLFFGLAAFVVAGLVLLGVTQGTVQLLIFSALSLSSLFLFRKKLLANFGRRKEEFQIDKKHVLVASAKIPARGEASIMYQGSPWKVQNEDDDPIEAGTRIEILRTEGVRLHVRAARSTEVPN